MAEPEALILTQILDGGVIVGRKRDAKLDVFSAEGLKVELETY